MVHKNSLQVYHNLVLPTIKAKHEAVIKALQVLGPSTSLDVADYLNKPLHTLSGRFSELSGNSVKEYGKPIIENIGERNNRYGNPCAIWQIITPKEPVKLEQAKLF